LRDPLLPEEVLAAADDRVRQRMRNSGEQWLIEADDERLGPAFRRYLLFARWPELLGDDAPELDAERRLYNTYYWLKRLAPVHGRARVRRRHGTAGIPAAGVPRCGG
jgi:hypothetical protein